MLNFRHNEINEHSWYWMLLLERCRYVDQHPVYHPEGNVLNHSLQTFNAALKESNDYSCVLAALLHDVGKFENPLGHDNLACEWLADCVPRKTLWLIKNHMRIRYLLNGKMRRKRRQ